jgi:ribosomal protein L37AE/L43A
MNLCDQCPFRSQVRTCPVCKTDYLPRADSQIYCSAKCREQFAAAATPVIDQLRREIEGLKRTITSMRNGSVAPSSRYRSNHSRDQHIVQMKDRGATLCQLAVEFNLSPTRIKQILQEQRMRRVAARNGVAS